VIIDDYRHAKDKNMLTVILALILIALVAFAAFLAFMLLRHNQFLYRLMVFLLLAPALILALVVMAAMISVKLVVAGKGHRLGTGRFVLRVVDAMLAPILALAGLLGIDRQKVQRAYAYLNNSIVFSREINLEPREVLLLLPHCIQNNRCRHRITGNIDNCRKCGACPVGSMLDIRDKYGINTAVVPGGTLARKAIKDLRPKAVVAVACERDLCSGIHDARFVPVVGIINERPHGPCFNTGVDIDRVEKAIKFLCCGRDF
jgi:hypothetical protein